MAGYLPLISYWTYADSYMLVSMATIVVFWCAESIAMRLLCEEDVASVCAYRDVDRYISAGYFALWAAVHVAIYVAGRCGTFYQPWLDVLNSQAEGCTDVVAPRDGAKGAKAKVKTDKLSA